MIIIYYVWSVVVDTFLFLRGLVYKVMGIPLVRVDIFAWLFIAGFAVFKVWWPPLSGQAKWTPMSGAISAAAFLGVALAFRLLFNRNHVFQNGWSQRLIEKAKGFTPSEKDDFRIEVVVGSGEPSTMRIASSDSSLFLTQLYDSTRGFEFPFNGTSVEMGRLFRYFQIRPALRLVSVSMGKASVYIFKIEPAVLMAVFAMIKSNQQTKPVMASGKRGLMLTAVAVGMLVAFTFGLWRITTVTHSEPHYPVGIVNSAQAGLYELPASKSRLISNLKLGEEVIIIEGSTDWYYVQNSSKQAGYVAKGLISLPK